MRRTSTSPLSIVCKLAGDSNILILLSFGIVISLASCAGIRQASPPSVLQLATTTSTADSGLLDAILPAFEQQHSAEVEVIAVGTGQALALGERGDVDVVLVHDPQKEEAFVEEGFGTARTPVMYNDFVIVGPNDDPAKIERLTSASEAFARITAAGTPFVSRGDESGTHSKEKLLWSQVGITPTSSHSWYKSLGQGMGETLIAANELEAYTLSDRGTFLAMQNRLANLRILVGGDTLAVNADPLLLNPYGVIPVNPATHPRVDIALAERFVAWLTSAETQAAIGHYGSKQFGQPLFHPAR